MKCLVSVTGLQPKTLAGPSRDAETHNRVRHDRVDKSGIVTLRVHCHRWSRTEGGGSRLAVLRPGDSIVARSNQVARSSGSSLPR